MAPQAGHSCDEGKQRSSTGRFVHCQRALAPRREPPGLPTSPRCVLLESGALQSALERAVQHEPHRAERGNEKPVIIEAKALRGDGGAVGNGSSAVPAGAAPEASAATTLASSHILAPCGAPIFTR
jgi:hypothetical protein